MKRTTEWTCDVCEKKETVISNEYSTGVEIPNFWMQGHILFQDDRDHLYIKALLCEACKKEFTDSRAYCRPKHKPSVFKKSLWQKIFKMGAKP